MEGTSRVKIWNMSGWKLEIIVPVCIRVFGTL